MTTLRQQLQNLLYELFQFDSADLRFGIYEVMYRKRKEIDYFIKHQLLDEIQSGLQDVANQSRGESRAALDAAKQMLIVGLGPDVLDKEGNVQNEHVINTPLVQSYLDAKKAYESSVISEELETDIYNHLIDFFSRYYRDGDFIPERRYGDKDDYAIPYSGDEVFLYWANRDQYYVKTGQYFTNYRFEVEKGVGLAQPVTVNFTLTEAHTARDNTKGERRYFVQPEDQPPVWDGESRTLTVPFQYRPLTAEESGEAGRNTQDALNQMAYEQILAGIADEGLRFRLAGPRRQGEEMTLLAYHLKRYTAANSRDFFVHKDLKGFLERELDYFLKAEVADLANLQSLDPVDLQREGAKIRTIRRIGERIIAFLDQIEAFQRLLFLKPKFVLQSDYCLTLDKIPETDRAELYPQIAANDEQRVAWLELYGVDLPADADLNRHLHLIVDTAFFDDTFKYRLLACFEDLDDATDGLLIHGENFHALNLLLSRYMNTVKCVHIDPPYNTQTSGFLYKNNYQHSSWLSMMFDRTELAIKMLSKNGSFLCHIDENEYERLQILCDYLAVPDAGTVIWDKRNPMNSGRGIATQHEYIIWRSFQETPIYRTVQSYQSILNMASNIIRKHGSVTEEARKEFSIWVSSNPELSGGEKAYRYLDEQGNVFQSVSLRAPEPRTDPKFHQPLVHPVTKKPCPVPPNGFSRTPETLQRMVANGEIIFGADETTQPRQKKVLDKNSQKQLSSVIREGKKGKADLSRLGLDFPYNHPVSLYEQLISVAAQSLNDVVLDFFAGSGTTAHAVMNLNRQDAGRRKYILVEMGEYFDTVLKPRIQKVAYASEWKDGKPVHSENGQAALFGSGQSHMFHYLRLESYDDTFHNIRFRDDAPEEARQLDDYLLTYMLPHETANSPTLLDVSSLGVPFDKQGGFAYKLKVTDENGRLQETPVDLITTFNFLIGLKVQTIRRFMWGKKPIVRVTGVNRGGRRICIVWRNAPTKPEQLDKERDWLLKHVLADVEYDKLYINGDNVVPEANLIDAEFKNLMTPKGEKE